MAIRDHVTRTPRMRGKITLVDPPNGIVEAVCRDGAARRIGIATTSTLFRWPIEGEEWAVYEQNGQWYLGERFTDIDTPPPLSAVATGESRIDSSTIWTPEGHRVNLNADLDVAALTGRTSTLELYTPRVITATAVSSISLGAIAGENITGVRISLHGYTSGGGTWIRLKPNGLATIATSTLIQRTAWPVGGPQVAQAIGGSNVNLVTAGLAVCDVAWASGGSNSNGVSASGVLFTKVMGFARRYWSGIYSAQDIAINGSTFLEGTLATLWEDTTTPITSLTLSVDSGTFTGRIVLEPLP